MAFPARNSVRHDDFLWTACPANRPTRGGARGRAGEWSEPDWRGGALSPRHRGKRLAHGVWRRHRTQTLAAPSRAPVAAVRNGATEPRLAPVWVWDAFRGPFSL